MTSLPRLFRNLIVFASTLLMLLIDAMQFLRLCLHPPMTLAAENLFLRKQLAMYQERQVKPQRATDATRLAFVWLSRWFDWQQAWRSCSRLLLRAGIARDSACSGGGNLVVDALRSLRTCKH